MGKKAQEIVKAFAKLPKASRERMQKHITKEFKGK